MTSPTMTAHVSSDRYAVIDKAFFSRSTLHQRVLFASINTSISSRLFQSMSCFLTFRETSQAVRTM